MLRRTLRAFFATEKHLDLPPKSAHFLLVHDTVKEVHPSAKVVANISKRRPFQAHMQILLEESTFDVRRIPRFIELFKKKLDSGFIETDPTYPYRMKLRFFDQAHITVMVGRDGVTPAMVNDCNDDMEREVLRASLGCDEIAYRDAQNQIVTIASSMCVTQQKLRLGEEYAYFVPRLFWLALCEDTYRRTPTEYPAPTSLCGVATQDMWRRIDPLPNPMLPEEDLLLLPSVAQLRHIGHSSFFSPAKAWQNFGREVNVIGDGVCPTTDEYQDLLVRRGIIEPPEPKKPGFFSRLFGWDKKKDDAASESSGDAADAAEEEKPAEIPKELRSARPVPEDGPLTEADLPPGATIPRPLRGDHQDQQFVTTRIGRRWVDIARNKWSY